MSRRGLSSPMRQMLGKIVIRGDDGYTTSVGNPQTKALKTRGLIESAVSPEQESIFSRRWRATEAGRAAFRPTDALK